MGLYKRGNILNNKFVEIIDYISEGEECEIIQCDGGKLFERESNS